MDNVNKFLKLKEKIAEIETKLLQLNNGSKEKLKVMRLLDALYENLDALNVVEEISDPLIEFDIEEYSNQENMVLSDSDSDVETLSIDEDFYQEVEAEEKLSGVGSILAINKKPLKANIDMCCIALIWKDAKPPKGSLSYMGNSVARVTADLSAGNTTMKITCYNIKVPYNKAKKNLYKAEDYAKRVADKKHGRPFDRYSIVNGNVRDYSNAGGNTAHLQSTNVRTALHENYHLSPFSLEHAGVIVDGKLDPYGDSLSFMGRYPTLKLNAPELWALGWPGVLNKTALFEKNDTVMQYNIEPIYYRKPSDNLTGVYMPREFRDMFLAQYLVKFKGDKEARKLFALHFMTNGGRGTQRIVMFSNETTQEGFTFKKIAEGDNYSTMEISRTSLA